VIIPYHLLGFSLSCQRKDHLARVEARISGQASSTPIRTEYDIIRPRIRRQLPRVFIVSYENTDKNINTTFAFSIRISAQPNSGVGSDILEYRRSAPCLVAIYTRMRVFFSRDTYESHRKFGAALVHSVCARYAICDMECLSQLIRNHVYAYSILWKAFSCSESACLEFWATQGESKRKEDNLLG